MAKKYIESDALIKSLATETGCMDRVFHAMDVADMVKNFPAADVRENEYSHKDWCPDGSKNLQCAECRAFVDLEDKYCHECGRVLLSEG